MFSCGLSVHVDAALLRPTIYDPTLRRIWFYTQLILIDLHRYGVYFIERTFCRRHVLCQCAFVQCDLYESAYDCERLCAVGLPY